MKKTFGVFQTKSSTWNSWTREFEGNLIQEGFLTLEEAEQFIMERLEKSADRTIRFLILPIYSN